MKKKIDIYMYTIPPDLIVDISVVKMLVIMLS